MVLLPSYFFPRAIIPLAQQYHNKVSIARIPCRNSKYAPIVAVQTFLVKPTSARAPEGLLVYSLELHLEQCRLHFIAAAVTA